MPRRVHPRSFPKPAIELFGYGGGGAALHHTTLASHVSEVCIEKHGENLINFWFLQGKKSVWGVNCAGFWGNLKVSLCDSLGGFCVEYGVCLHQR